MRALLPMLGTSLLALALALAAHAARHALTPKAAWVAPGAAAPGATLSAPEAGSASSLPAEQPTAFYEPVTARPLFAPSRRPAVIAPEPADQAPPNEVVEETGPAVPPPEPEPEDETPPELRLHGVMTGVAIHKALVSTPEMPPRWLRINAELSGWRITDIGADGIELARGAQRLRMSDRPPLSGPGRMLVRHRPWRHGEAGRRSSPG